MAEAVTEAEVVAVTVTVSSVSEAVAVSKAVAEAVTMAEAVDTLVESSPSSLQVFRGSPINDPHCYHNNRALSNS